MIKSKRFCHFAKLLQIKIFNVFTSRPCGSSSNYHSQIRSVHNDTQPLPRLPEKRKKSLLKVYFQCNPKFYLTPSFFITCNKVNHNDRVFSVISSMVELRGIRKDGWNKHMRVCPSWIWEQSVIAVTGTDNRKKTLQSWLATKLRDV